MEVQGGRGLGNGREPASAAVDRAPSLYVTALGDMAVGIDIDQHVVAAAPIVQDHAPEAALRVEDGKGPLEADRMLQRRPALPVGEEEGRFSLPVGIEKLE